MTIRIIALIMCIHECPLGRLLGKEGLGGREAGTQQQGALGEGTAIYVTEFKGAQ
jgi:hypothetical protein